ncbi:methylated-DNA--[protein]-cysteine S-methyltransferase [Ferruginibacter sp. HRS2-29]|uniref:methylated-DNA--[protein]-cysteine S-methyltransferase n=1 Tax=Ferruginibacter sp. HRS2-29 TaxID=2487334 RepID=UPI0020CEA298|nr:methylated-DNA--[protein]-cysteine S-methyltransferase [Ferruginibacter sp. HRS2-29]MCP9750093.1 methylated-DNA--[protein]-cysteine S-methyltransferase [Ferruginibacter sp. HRS2-29]
MNETIFYNSPLGILRLSNNGNALAGMSFVQTGKNKHLTDEEIKFISPQTGILQKCITQLDDYFAGRELNFDLPLLQPGTEFQQKVWVELQNISPGKTISYLQMSKNLGNVKAIRAVGTANGRNNIAIIVPCHRVIGSNGTLVGYAGDLWRKQWLLDHEAKFVNGVRTLF